LSKGSTRKLASEANGITPRIFDIWQNQGRIDVEHEQDSLCAYLVLSLAVIRQKHVQKCQQKIEKSPKGHKGCEWILEHAYWREFGPSAPTLELAAEIEQLRNQLALAKGNGNDKANECETEEDSEC
jgi:hypothetical protein